ncbi:MAG: amino acid racemase [Candidatus Aminicenantes bacterium]|nr:amino acid racemase [Candidatus Aminicenantes bacterium]
MAKRIGILGGISHESTIKYYKYILTKYFVKKRDYHYPEVVIFSLDLAKLTGFEDSGDINGYIEYIMTGVQALENAGADFIVIAANSPHSVFEVIQKKAKIPLISIVEVTAGEAQRLGMKNVLLLGIKYTMQSAFYKDVFKKHKMHVIVPSIKEQEEINRIIFDELVLGVFKEGTRQRLLDIIGGHERDGVILGCTELSLILNQEDTDVKLLNTLELHARAALEYALQT